MSRGTKDRGDQAREDGVISGGPVTHECPPSRSIGYFLEPIFMLAPFSKKPLALTLRGITTDNKDLSVCLLQPSRWIRQLILLKVDLIRTVTLPHLEPFGSPMGWNSESVIHSLLEIMLTRMQRLGDGAHLC